MNLWIRSKRNPDVGTNFSILLDYKHTYNLELWGSSGYSGTDGFNGRSGLAGGHGSNGGLGGNGQPGYKGPDVGVWVDLYFDSILNCELLYVYAEDFESGEEYCYLVNPDGGKIKVSSQGGTGGRGGDGGAGGDGGQGRDGRIWYETVTRTRTAGRRGRWW